MQFGHYELIHEIGRGGMGVVWRARDEKVGREVAIKILPQDLTHGAQFRERFEREARTVARLEHSAIVPIYDVGQADKQPYISMRLMPGGSLADKIRMGPIALDDCIPIIRRIADALDAAHNAGIVHRDIKPGNILFDGYNDAHLSDFGIVKLAESDGANLTETGKTLGTPAYMAPEMAETGAATPQVDIYALGITLYYMLTGELPYGGTTPVGIMMAHIKRPIPNILEKRPDLPAGIQNVLATAMAKHPASRYQTAPQFAQAIADAATGQQVAPPSTTMPVETAAPPPTAQPDNDGGGIGMLLVGGGVIAIVLVIGLIAAAVGFFLLPNMASSPTPTTADVAEATEAPTNEETPAAADDDDTPTATFTAVPSATPTADNSTIEAEVEQAITAYEEARRYLLETLDECCIADYARGEALQDRLNAVDILTRAGNCTWDYDFEGLTFNRTDVISATEVQVWATKAESGTVFCGEVERSEFAFTGPTIVFYELDLYSDGWYVTYTENVDEVGQGRSEED